MKGNGKEEIIKKLEKEWNPARIKLAATLNQKEPNAVPGLEPGLLRQNAMVLPLAPPPLKLLKSPKIRVLNHEEYT